MFHIGKIVVYNFDFISYGASVKYRSHGAARAARHGAVATLVRSVTPFSLYTLHTGQQDYEENTRKIPTASITVEDARMLQRLQVCSYKLLKYNTYGLMFSPTQQTIELPLIICFNYLVTMFRRYTKLVT